MGFDRAQAVFEIPEWIQMKKVLSLAVVLGILLSTAPGIFAQKAKRGDLLGKQTGRRAAVADSRTAQQTEFDSGEAISAGKGALLSWKMKSEIANMGFRIYRRDGISLEFINSELVFGSASKAGRYPVFGEEYAYFDSNGTLGSVYQIEFVDLDGKSGFSLPIQAAYGQLPKLKGRSIPGMDDVRTGAKSGQLTSSALRMPKDLAAEIESQSFGSGDPDVHRWVMSRPGVRLDVKTEGIYRVSFAQLQAAGFDTSSNTANWQLYLRGAEQSINLDVNGQFIEFYGKGVDRVETDIQGYFLVTGDTAGKRMRPYVARPTNNSAVLTSYGQTFTFKERTIYLNSILNGDPENYFGRSISSSGATINFDLTGVDFNSPTSTIRIKVQGYSAGNHLVRVMLNGVEIDTFPGVAQFPFEMTKIIQTSLLKDAALGQGQNALNLTSIAPNGDFNLFDTLEISFQRKPLAQQKTLKAYTLNSRKSLLRGFPSADVRVFDISREHDPQIITNLPFHAVDGAFGVDLPAARGRAYFAVEDTGILSPHAIVAHDSEILSSSTHDAAFVVIAYKDFLTEANAWATYRANQGFTTKVVNVDEIYNEFNYGSLSSDSIESFLNYAYNNWQGQPQYVLLIGDASYDSRVYQSCASCGFFNYVPTRIVTTVFTETGSDESLADFNDDGLAEIPIGRIPAREGSQVTTALSKVANWEANLNNPLNRGALFAYDQPDGYDFETMSETLRDELPAGTAATMILRRYLPSPPDPPGTPDPQAQIDLLAAMNTGKYIVNYSGHGSAGVWAATSFFGNSNVPSLTNINNESIFTALTCLNGYFLSLGGTSLAENLLIANNGGAVVVWASTGLTTPDVQEIMARRFYNQIGQGDIPRVGDLIKDAKTVLAGGTDVRLSWALIGDPMLKVR